LNMIPITPGGDLRRTPAAPTCVIITGMEHPHIEPGLINVFRLTIGVQAALALLAFCGESLDEEQAVQFITWFALLHSSLLFGLLSWRWIAARLGRWFLPLALFSASVGPMVGIALATAIRLDQGVRGGAVWVSPGGLLLWLIVPLLLISTQYRMRAMFGFTFSTALLEVVLIAPLIHAAGAPMDPVFEQILVRVMIFVVVGYVVVRLSAAQRDHRRALAEKNAQLSHYAATLEQLAVSRERNRLARDLHDTLAHTLSATSVQLQALGVLLDTDPNAARDHLRATQDMMRSGLQEARRALRALRASPLEDLGLLLALRQLAESTAVRAGLRLDLHLPEALDPLPPETEQHLYRIAEEALTNVVRHAEAKALWVSLRREPNKHPPARLELLIRDDGQGFDPAAPEGGIGLVGMRERATLCGGTVEVSSQPQHGTTITVVVGETQ
jgi:signal transduction histidine kinase